MKLISGFWDDQVLNDKKMMEIKKSRDTIGCKKNLHTSYFIIH